MPKCLNHEQVAKRFINDLLALCEKHEVTMVSETLIDVHIEAVYNKESGLYEEYGADFTLGRVFPETGDKERYK